MPNDGTLTRSKTCHPVQVPEPPRFIRCQSRRIGHRSGGQAPRARPSGRGGYRGWKADVRRRVCV